MAGGRKPAAPPDAYQKALGLLVRREHSRRELGRKLAQRGLDREEAGPALDRLADQGFQDDDRFAVSFARTRAGAGYGPVRIRAELGTHGLQAAQIDAALEACEADWEAMARDQVERRYRGKSLADPAARRKAVEFLLRRGFDQGAAYGAVRWHPGAGDDEA